MTGKQFLSLVTNKNKVLKKSSSLLKIFVLLTLFLTVFITFFVAWMIISVTEATTNEALTRGRSLFNVVVLTRYWNSLHGGVYVPVSEETQPNPYLDVPHRDVSTKNGRALTLINPAFMTRQIAELALDSDQTQFHITSLKPIRPENYPTKWEAEALRNFSAKGDEYFKWAIPDSKGRIIFKYMAPLWTEKACLKCHEKQGYIEGDLRGGISVSSPAGAILSARDRNILTIILWSFITWLLGFSGLFFSFRVMTKEYKKSKWAEEVLQESEKNLDEIVEFSPVGIGVTDIEGNILKINQKFIELFGYNLKDIPTVFDWYPKAYPDKDYREKAIANWKENVTKAVEEGIETPSKVYRVTCKDGSTRHVEITMKSGRGKNLFTFVDVTGRKQAEEKIKAALKEKETLLHEIHHRVKNNLTVVSSLLGLQSRSMNDERLTEALMESRNRVLSMSMIHEILYQSESLSSIDMNSYLSKLGKTVARNYAIAGKVSLEIEAENIMIGAKQASPVGLIVNELIANSFKYAFPDNREGKIKISLRKIANQIELNYADDGIGIAKDFDWENTKSMGLHLVKILAEGQLGGTIELNRDRGTCFVITFRHQGNP